MVGTPATLRREARQSRAYGEAAQRRASVPDALLFDQLEAESSAMSQRTNSPAFIAWISQGAGAKTIDRIGAYHEAGHAVIMGVIGPQYVRAIILDGLDGKTLATDPPANLRGTAERVKQRLAKRLRLW